MKNDVRRRQAKRLFDRRFGGKRSFKEYLASIPPIPEFPKSYVKRFPELVLVDTSLPISKQCKLLDLFFPGDDRTFVPFGPKRAKTVKVYWIRAQLGHTNSGKSVSASRATFKKDELGLTAHEGLALFAQNSKALKGRGIDLPGSVHIRGRIAAACLCWLGVRPCLTWYWGGIGHRSCGSASRGK